ncbi:DUF1835 domain-containing protein [Paenibacillus sp. LHD-117]|uniref:DUF1835 domain-containing protein n=1 Tax=Paenibacillus sp. LHD-117 TaxID=3071412 RepID=UPI0027E17214|nr:DUF1835 domain-containing protein [Paenibacillus sp. LHD-117]MDQ6420569.1 DUF1835 domain-containing protein [Paenibacillus sp. LHD-117]
MLHIVNGDSVGDKLKQGGIEGDILVWREVYTAGPVFPDMAESRSRLTRAQFMEQAFGVPLNDYIAISGAQEQTLRQYKSHDEIVLWFEYDLFDQTMLSQLLHYFSGQQLGDTKLNLLCLGSFPGIPDFRGLGQLTAEQLMSLTGTWKLLGSEELELGRKVWESYASPDIEEHNRMLQADLFRLPFMRAALEAHLSRLPSVHNGLGSIEQATLEAAASGIGSPYELFDYVGGRLHSLGIGDLEYWLRLAKLTEQPEPLLHKEGSSSFPDFHGHPPEFKESFFTLTELGRRTLAGEADWTEHFRIDEWLGGFRLRSGSPWRWDTSRRAVVRSE